MNTPRSTPLAKTRSAASRMALAIALVTGTAIGVTAFAEPAQAQRAKRDKEKSNKASKSKYSEAFVAAYNPLDGLIKAQPVDAAALRAAIETADAAAQNPDEKYAIGGMLNNAGITLDDQALQRRGIVAMLDSGLVPAENVPQYTYSAGQLAYFANDYEAARDQFTKAAAAGYDKTDLVPIIADTYFQKEDYASGLRYLKGKLNELNAAGQKPPQDWIRRGLAASYNNDLSSEAVEFAAMYAQYYPSTENWREAINIHRNILLLENPELLDLMRLGDMTGALNSERDYFEYVDAADVLRLPGEVKRILDKGIAEGVINGSGQRISETLKSANSRIAADKADLADLEGEARSAATASLARSTADAYLGYEMGDKAEALYEIALTKGDGNASLIYTRLGIAQLMQGKVEAAKASFAKAEGNRAAIAKLWTVFADQQQRPALEQAAAPTTAS